MKLIKSVKSAAQYIGAAIAAPSKSQIQLMLLLLGVSLLSAGVLSGAHAYGDELEVNEVRFGESVKVVLQYLEGSLGALVMVVSGIGAIMSAAFGQYKAALGCLVVAVGAFVLRSFLFTFFNLEDLDIESA